MSCVDVSPQLFFVANGAKFFNVVERARRSCTKSSNNLSHSQLITFSAMIIRYYVELTKNGIFPFAMSSSMADWSATARK